MVSSPRGQGSPRNNNTGFVSMKFHSHDIPTHHLNASELQQSIDALNASRRMEPTQSFQQSMGLKKLLHRVQFIFLLLSLIPFILVTIQYATQKPVFQIEAVPIENPKLPPIEVCAPYGLPNIKPKAEFYPFLREINREFLITSSLFEVVCFRNPSIDINEDVSCTRAQSEMYTKTYWKSIDPEISPSQCEQALGTVFHYDLLQYAREIEACRSCVAIKDSEELAATSDRANLTSMTIRLSPSARCFADAEAGQVVEGSYEDSAVMITVMIAIVRHYWNAFIDLGLIDASRTFFEEVEAVIGGRYEVFYALIPTEMYCDLMLYSGFFYETQFDQVPFKYTFDFLTTSWIKSGETPKYHIGGNHSQLVQNLDVNVIESVHIVDDETHAMTFGDINTSIAPIARGQSLLFGYQLEKDLDENVRLHLEITTRARKEYFDYVFEFHYESKFMSVVSISYAESGLEYFNNAFGYFSLFAGLTIFSMLAYAIQAWMWMKRKIQTQHDDEHDPDAREISAEDASDDALCADQGRNGWRSQSRFRVWVLRYMDLDGDGKVSQSERASTMLSLLFVVCLIVSIVLMILSTVDYATQRALISIEKKTYQTNDFLIPNLLFCTQAQVPSFETTPKVLKSEYLLAPSRATCVKHGVNEYCGRDLDQVMKRVWKRDEVLMDVVNNTFANVVDECLDAECESCYLYQRQTGMESSVNPSLAFSFSVEWSTGFRCCFTDCVSCCDPNLFQVVLDYWDELVDAGIINDFGSGRPIIGNFWRIIGGRGAQKTPVCDIVFSSGFFFDYFPQFNVKYNWNAIRLLLEIADDSDPSRFPLAQHDLQAMKIYAGLEQDLSDLKLHTLMSMGTDEFLIVEEDAASEQAQDRANGVEVSEKRVLRSHSQRSTGVESKHVRERAGRPSANFTLTVYHKSIDYEVLSVRYPYQFLEYLNDLGGFLGNFTGLSVFGIFFYLIPLLFKWNEKRNAERLTKTAQMQDEMTQDPSEKYAAQVVTVDGDAFRFEPATMDSAHEHDENDAAQKSRKSWMTPVFDVDRDGKVSSIDVYVFSLILIFSLMLVAMIIACVFLVIDFVKSPSFLSFEKQSVDASVAALPPIVICSASRGSNLAARIRNDNGRVLGLSRVGSGAFTPTFDRDTEYLDEEWSGQHAQTFVQTERSSEQECRGVMSSDWKTQFESDCQYCVRLGDQDAGLEPLTGFVDDNQLIVDFASDYYYPFCFTGGYKTGVSTLFYRTHELSVFLARRQEFLDAGKIRIDDGSPLEEFGTEDFGMSDQMLCNLVYFSDLIYETDVVANFTVVKHGTSEYSFVGEDIIATYADQFLALRSWRLDNDLEIFIIEENESQGTKSRDVRYLGQAAADDQMAIVLEPQTIDGITRHTWTIFTHPFAAPDETTQLHYIRLRFALESNTVWTFTTTPSYQWLQFVTDLFGFPGFFVGLAFFNGVYILVIVLYSRKHSDEKARMEALNRFDDSEETRDVDMFDTKKVGRDHRFNIRALLFTFDVLSRIKA